MYIWDEVPQMKTIHYSISILMLSLCHAFLDSPLCLYWGTGWEEGGVITKECFRDIKVHVYTKGSKSEDILERKKCPHMKGKGNDKKVLYSDFMICWDLVTSISGYYVPKNSPGLMQDRLFKPHCI